MKSAMYPLGYGPYDWGYSLEDGDIYNDERRSNGGKGCSPGDVVKMTVNKKEGEYKIYFNGEVAYEGFDNYLHFVTNFAVLLGNKHQSL